MLRCLALALALALLPPPGLAQMVEATSRLTWAEPYETFGSFSGLAISPDGTSFTTVSDKGFYATGTLARKNGRLAAASLLRAGPLLRVDGTPVSRFDIDAEGITRLPDGRFAVSFEANHRIRLYSDIAEPPAPLDAPPAFRSLQNNSGIEALFSDPAGHIYAIPERSGALDRPYPVFRRAKGWSTPFTLPRSGPYLVVGADIGPDGRLYVLERDLGILGFRARIRRYTLGPSGPGKGELVVETASGAYDNLEGLALWQGPDGRLRILCISDDNNRFFQRTEFVEFTLTAESSGPS